MSEFMLRTPTKKSTVGVDRENKALMGFVVAELGEAKGHGVDLDETTLDQLMEAGNGITGGAKMRFTHPNMSSDGLGKYLGRARNFRRDGNLLRADGFLGRSSFVTPNGDLGSYVMDLAEEDPDAFGASVAIRAEREQRLEKDGTPKKGPDGNPLLPVLRVKKLHAVDVVDQPAATSAMFSTDDAPDAWARKATAFADELGERLGIGPEDVALKVQEFIPRYLASKGVVMSDKSQEQPAAPSNPAPANPQLPAADIETAKLAERKRVSEITALCKRHQLDALAAKLIEDGVELSEAPKFVLSAIEKRDVPLPSGGAEAQKDKPEDPDAKFRAEYRENEELLSTFGDEASYIESRKRSEKGGKISLTGKAG